MKRKTLLGVQAAQSSPAESGRPQLGHFVDDGSFIPAGLLHIMTR
jgi:hypothetical protein